MYLVNIYDERKQEDGSLYKYIYASSEFTDIETANKFSNYYNRIGLETKIIKYEEDSTFNRTNETA